MSRLDRHVNLVRNKLAMGTLLKALAWAMLGFAFVVLLNILVDRFLARRLPHYGVFFLVGLGVTVAGAIAYSIWRRPSSRQAAIAIDDRLGLKEKFSTALYVRSSTDPFAAATVRDAEVTADNVSLHKRFPVPFPKAMIATITLTVVTLLTAKFLPAYPLFADDDAARKHDQLIKDNKTADARKMVAKAIAEIDNTPALTSADAVKIETARRELQELQGKPIHDEVAAQRSAQKAMEDMQAIKDKVKEIHDKALQAKNDSELFKTIGPPIDDAGPMGEVSKDIAKGDFGKAAQDVESAVKHFDQEKPEDQQKTAEDMAKLANQLKQVANNTDVQKKIADKLQQAGATSQQMNQLAKALQGAANGDKQAQQQVNQIANQIAQQANQQQPGQTPQQQQAQSKQIQQMVKQMQGNANSQQTAQSMAAAASALAKQMAAQAKAGQQGGQQGQQGSQAQAAAQGKQGSQAGSQPGQAQAGNQGAQPGQQPGGQQGQGQQSIADAKADMQQQLQNLQEAADAQAEAQAQQQGDGQNGNNGNDGNGGQQQSAMAGGQGTWKPGDAKDHGAGSGGPGVSDGGARPKGIETPVGFEKTIAASVADDKGKLLNSRWVKTTAEKGTSRVELHDVVQSAEKDAADEVDQDRISRPEQAVVKRYFDDLKQEASPAPAPSK
jgi:hypothetical protein